LFGTPAVAAVLPDRLLAETAPIDDSVFCLGVMPQALWQHIRSLRPLGGTNMESGAFCLETA
jgi:hypothetical protein